MTVETGGATDDGHHAVGDRQLKEGVDVGVGQPVSDAAQPQLRLQLRAQLPAPRGLVRPERRSVEAVPAQSRDEHLRGESAADEAVVEYTAGRGLEQAMENDTGTIITDLATTYRSEAHARDQLLFEVGVMDFNTYGGDITFRITRPRDQALVAMAKSGLVFFNYKTRMVTAMPEAFYRKFERVNWV